MVHAIAVGRLDHDVIGLRNQFWIVYDGPVRPAYVTGEQDRSLLAAVARPDPYDRRAENVPGIMETYLYILIELDALFVFHGQEVRETGFGISDGIERLLRKAPLAPFLLVSLGFVLGVFFLYLGRIQQNYPRYFRCGGGAIYPAPESVPHQFRQQAAMIQMRVSQKDRIYASRLDRERFPVSLLEVAFLIKPAIDEKLGAVDLKEMSGARHILNGAKKLQFHRHIVPRYGIE